MNMAICGATAGFCEQCGVGEAVGLPHVTGKLYNTTGADY